MAHCPARKRSSTSTLSLALCASGEAGASATTDVRDGTRAPGKVAIFSTCYINYNEPGIGHDLARVLDHNQIPWTLVEKEACCGMPKLELGDLEAVAALKDKNIPPLAKLAREGYAIVTPIPEPQMRSPRSASPRSMRSATARAASG